MNTPLYELANSFATMNQRTDIAKTQKIGLGGQIFKKSSAVQIWLPQREANSQRFCNIPSRQQTNHLIGSIIFVSTADERDYGRPPQQLQSKNEFFSD
jgi:hypothetical protein